jgi:hypothetical protein
MSAFPQTWPVVDSAQECGSKPGLHQQQCECRERDQPLTLRIAAQDSRPRRHTMRLSKLPAGTHPQFFDSTAGERSGGSRERRDGPLWTKGRGDTLGNEPLNLLPSREEAGLSARVIMPTRTSSESRRFSAKETYVYECLSILKRKRRKRVATFADNRLPGRLRSPRRDLA